MKYAAFGPDEPEVPDKVKPKVRLYPLLARAVEEGIAYGYRRAHKHVDDPGADAIRTAIHDAVMAELVEILDLE
jgi:hypothetical protein